MVAACLRSGRAADAAELVAISKTVPVERLRLAQAAGHPTLGENRVQEAAGKIPVLEPAEWHLVGHLQKNKVAKAIELFDVIESVDSLALAARLDRLAGERGTRGGRRLPVYLQVNVDADPAKAGFAPDALERDLEDLLGLPNLEIRGLMTVGFFTGGGEAARPTFARLRELSERLREADLRLGPGLSMGLTDTIEPDKNEWKTSSPSCSSRWPPRPGSWCSAAC